MHTVETGNSTIQPCEKLWANFCCFRSPGKLWSVCKNAVGVLDKRNELLTITIYLVYSHTLMLICILSHWCYHWFATCYNLPTQSSRSCCKQQHNWAALYRRRHPRRRLLLCPCVSIVEPVLCRVKYWADAVMSRCASGWVCGRECGRVWMQLSR